MLVKTKSIVFSNTNYSENSLVTKLFTKEYGIISVLVNGVRNNKGIVKKSHLQPLNILDTVIYYKPNSGLQRIKEVKVSPPLYNIYSNPVKLTIGALLTESLVKAIKEEEQNFELFEFVESLILFLDESEQKDLNIFPSYFLLRLAALMGQEFTNVANSPNQGIYSNTISSLELQEAMNNMGKLNYRELQALGWNKSFRIQLLNEVVSFFEKEVLDNKKLNSMLVIKQLFS